MRVRTVFLVALLLAVVPSGAAAARGHGELVGTVLDITCPGPCRPGLMGKPFQGEAVVEARRARDRRLVARTSVTGGQFALAVRPGRYDVTVVPYPAEQPSCWQGSTLPAHVHRGQIVALQLTVANGCVV